MRVRVILSRILAVPLLGQ